MTPASIGAQLEDRRVTRIRDVLDFPEELESRENCGDRHRSSAIPSHAPGPKMQQKSKKDPHLEQWAEGATGGSGKGSPKAGRRVRCRGHKWHSWSPLVTKVPLHYQGSSLVPTCRMSGNLESLWTAMGSRCCLLD